MIAPMSRLEIVCMRGSLHDVVTFMQEHGALHIEEVPVAENEVPEFLDRVTLTDDQRRDTEHLDDLHRTLAEAVPLLTVKPNSEYVAAAGNSLKDRTEDELAELAISWCRQLRALTRRKLNVQDNLEILNSFFSTLQTLEPLMGGKTVMLGRDARAFVLKGDVGKALERLEERRKGEIGADSKLLTKQVSRSVVVGMLMYPESRNDKVSKLFHEEMISAVELPDRDLKGASLQDVLQKVKLSVAKHNSDAAELSTKLANYSKEIGAQLVALAAKVIDRVALSRAMGSFAQSNMVGVIHGWAPTDTVDSLTSNLATTYPGKVIVTSLPMNEIDSHEVPTQLRNHKIFQPFESLLLLLKPPTYGTIDATGLVAVSFVLFYGFIIGDVGYAAVIAAFGYGLRGLLRSKFGPVKLFDDIAVVFYWMGASSAFFGFVFGEFFGEIGHDYLHMPVFFHRMEDVTTLMIIAIIFGAIHIPLSLILGVVADFKHHHKAHAFEKLGHLCGLLGLGTLVLHMAGVSLFASGVAMWAGVVLLILFIVLEAMAARSLMALVFILEIVSKVGNVMSYCRLMALGLVGVIIANLANQLGGAFGNGAGLAIGIPLAAVVHLLNIGLSIFSPTIHSVRLNYVEFLPKFFQPEGKKYKPFTKEALW